LIKNSFVLAGSYDNTYECVFEKVYFRYVYLKIWLTMC